MRRVAWVVATWLGSVGSGLWLLVDHGIRPGAVGEVPPRLPADLGPRLECTGQLALLVAAHPQCPCLPSTLGELARILAASGARPAVRLLTFAPSSPPPDWDPAARPDLRGLAGARAIADPDGQLAARLGALTSGHVLLFDATGQRRFSGGITAGRGHRGDNQAARTLLEILSNPAAATAETAVFGCPLEFIPTTHDCPNCRSD